MKLYKRNIVLMLLLFSFIATSAVIVVPNIQASPGPVKNINTGEQFNTIQAAIDDSDTLDGHTITVDPGTYLLTAPIVVDKAINILGAQANVDPRPSVGGRTGPETILVSSTTVFDIQANNVEINGFKIESSINNANLNIVQEVNSAYYDNVKVLYNIIYNIGYPSYKMNEAVKIRTGTNAFVAYNYIYNIPSPGDGINFDRVSDGTIAYNELHNQGSENAAIYVYGSTGTTIIGNIVYDVPLNDGIKLGSKDGGDASKVGGLIKDNVVYNTRQDGITVYMSGVTVEGNEVYNSQSENGAIYVAFAVSNIIIRCNTIRDNTLSTNKRATAAGILLEYRVDVSSVTIKYNNIYGNTPYGLTNEAATSLDARFNWWGDASGPSGVGPGAGDAISGNVNFNPWLTQKYASTKSVATATGTGMAHFSLDVCTGAIEGLAAIPEGTLPLTGKPNLIFPHGFFSFKIVGLNPGATVTVTITLPSNMPVGTQYWKYQSSKGWYQIPIGDDDGDNVITITLTDGGLGDADGAANGVIIDPGGPGKPRPVGGIWVPINKFELLVPWIGLVSLMTAVAMSVVYVKYRKKQQN